MLLNQLIQSITTPFFLKGHNLNYTAALFLGAVGGLIGSLTYQKSESLIGDALGHSVFPGVMLAFIFIGGRKINLFLSIGAVIIGLIAYILINVITNSSKFRPETIMAIILSMFFGFGMVIHRYILYSAKYRKSSQSRGLEDYIFGQIAYVSKEDVISLIVLFCISVTTICLIYKELKVHLFDREFATIQKFSHKIISSIIIILTLVFIAFGIKMVGVILIAAILVTPATTAAQWVKRFSSFIILSTTVGGIGSFIGMFAAINIEKAVKHSISATSVIIMLLASISIISIMIGPKGFIFNLLKKKHKRKFYKEKRGKF